MVTFMYGQRATTREVEQAKHFAKLLAVVEHQVIDVSFMKQLYGKTNSLTDATLDLAKNFDTVL